MKNVNITINENLYNFQLNELMEIGQRTNNSKRNFLFISKLLGKHIIVNPDICKSAGLLLSSLKYNNINNKNIVEYIKGESTDIKKDLEQVSNNTNKVLVIGFAETATGLGMSVASSINNCTFWTTTREDVVNVKNLLTFEEEHCHATTHNLFSLTDASFDDYDEIILVDDEITTGKSMLNLIDAIKNISNIKKFNIMTILDWRADNYRDDYKKYIEENNIEINVYSIMSGSVTPANNNVYSDLTEIEEITVKTNVEKLDIIERTSVNTEHGVINYVKNSGRFSTSQKEIKNLENICKDIANKINTNKKILVLGHGENIYIPSRVASYLNAEFRTTTRSPIYCDGKIIKTKHKFVDRDVTYFFYNKEEIESKYDEVILITDTPLDLKLTDNLKIYQI